MKSFIVESGTAYDDDMEGPITILAVDDNDVVLEFLARQISHLGHVMLVAKNGHEALAMLETETNKIDIVLMDWAMPIMDGMAAISRMKNNKFLRHIPVIMLTGADKPEEIKEGLAAGVYYYLTKPVKKIILRSVIDSARRSVRQNKMMTHELSQHRRSFELIDSCRFKFSTLAEAENLAVFMANCFPDPRRALPGLGELMINAIEHGNLAIGFEQKQKLLEEGMWRMEVERLQNAPEHAGKSATATISRKPEGIYVVIEDQGAGFAWEKFLSIEPSRAERSHGRGIAQARAVSFDKLTYNEKGNKAIALSQYGGKLEW